MVKQGFVMAMFSNRRLFTLSVAMIRHRFSNRLSEWSNALAMLLAGYIMSRSGGTFDLAAYDVLRQIAGPDTWARMLLTVGIVRIVVLAINGSVIPRGSPHLRAFLASTAALIWSVMLAGFMAFPTLLVITGFIGVAMVADVINSYRAILEAGQEDVECGGRRNGSTG